jgi:hypothetical protein
MGHFARHCFSNFYGQFDMGSKVIMGKLKEAVIEAQGSFDFGDTTPAVRKPNLTQRIASNWVRYYHVNKLKPNTEKYKQAQHAYLCGIGIILGEEMPTLLSLCVASGRDIASIIERTQPR